MISPRISRRSFLASGVAVSLIDFSARAEPGADGFLTLEAAPAALRLLPEPAAKTPVFAYNASVPGPLLRYKKGEEVKVRLVNKLAQPTSLAWPGVRIANAMDGVAGLTQQPVAPGESFDYRFTPPDSGLFSYRPGVSPFVGEQLGRGLFGALIVEEPDPPPADRDMLAILADWRLDGDGALIADFGAEADVRGAGRIGSMITVNAEPAPTTLTMAPGSRVRLRLVSAMAARIMPLSFEGARPIILAIDGQPVESPFEPASAAIPVGPGARFDIMFDLARDAGADARLVLNDGGGPARALIIFTTAGAPRAALPAIAALPVNRLLPAAIRLQDAARAEFIIEPAKTPANGLYWTVNGAAAEAFPATPLLSVRRGAPVALAIVNKSAVVQQIHVHGHAMRLLHDLDDGWDPYWRDSVLLAPGRTKHVAFIADNPGKWAIESLIPDRSASGLSAWFLVI